MKPEHKFGGDWTAEKLERIRKYLCAYMKIFSRNPRAKKLNTIYVDAFAGTGYRTQPPQLDAHSMLFSGLAEPDAEKLLKGSAWIALEVEPPFHEYIFIERDRDYVRELEKLKQHFPGRARSIHIVNQDANVYLKEWCKRTDWRTHRAVVFLDPYGMEVEWTLIQAIAETRAIDLWLLFPLGVAVNRLLTSKREPPPKWTYALTRILGTEKWKEEFYARVEMPTLFDTVTEIQKEADFEKIGRFFVNRLKEVFAGVAERPLPLHNSRNVPLYLLCFAAGNPKGARTAIKIAQYILKP